MRGMVRCRLTPVNLRQPFEKRSVSRYTEGRLKKEAIIVKTIKESQRWYGYVFMGLSVLALFLTVVVTAAWFQRALLLTTALTLLVYGLTYEAKITRKWWRILLAVSGVVLVLDIGTTLVTTTYLLKPLLSFLLPLVFLGILLGYLRRFITR